MGYGQHIFFPSEHRLRNRPFCLFNCPLVIPPTFISVSGYGLQRYEFLCDYALSRTRIIAHDDIFYAKRMFQPASIRIYNTLAFPYDKKSITLRGKSVGRLSALQAIAPTSLSEA